MLAIALDPIGPTVPPAAPSQLIDFGSGGGCMLLKFCTYVNEETV